MLLSALSELEEIVSKLLLLDVHHVVVDEHEFFDSLSELSLDIDNCLRHGLSFGVTNLNSLELVELDDGLSQLHNVLASLDEGVEADEESTGSDLPGIGGLSLGVVIGLLKLGAELHAQRQFVVSVRWVIILDCTKDFVAVDLLTTLENDGIADLSDEDQEASWSVIVLRVGVDQHDGVHDRDEVLGNIGQIERGVDESVEIFLKGLKVLVVFISLDSGNVHFFLEFAEGTRLSGLVLLEELEDLLHALASELLTNGVEVGGFVPPEGQLSEGVGMVSLFESHLWVLSELGLDLTRPVDGGVLKHGSLVFRRGFLVLSDVSGG